MYRIFFISIFIGFHILSYSQVGWVQQTSGTTHFLEKVYFVNVNSGWAVGKDGLILFTTNGGANWVPQTSGIPNTLESVRFISSSTGFAVSRSGDILRTTNSGINWQNTNIGDTNWLNAVSFNGAVGFTGNKSLYKTTNFGINWIIVNPTSSPTTIFDINFLNDNTGFLVNYNKILKTTNGGINFEESSSQGGYSIYFVNSNTGFVGSNQLQITTNSGINWTIKSIPANIRIETIFFINETTGYLVSESGHDSTVQKTIDAGNTWLPQVVPSGAYYDIFFVDNNTGWAVGSSGKIMKTTTGGNPIGIQVVSSEIPEKYRLLQNYPNPFNPVTNIVFDISTLSNVRLTVFDLTGREIARLINRELRSGKYKVDWDATNYPSGVYLYRIEATDFTETKKMVLIK